MESILLLLFFQGIFRLSFLRVDCKKVPAFCFTNENAPTKVGSFPRPLHIELRLFCRLPRINLCHYDRVTNFQECWREFNFLAGFLCEETCLCSLGPYLDPKKGRFCERGKLRGNLVAHSFHPEEPVAIRETRLY